MAHFSLPLFLPRLQEGGPYFPPLALECADLQRLIAFGGEALQLRDLWGAATIHYSCLLYRFHGHHYLEKVIRMT
jgi:hypothetical protein